VEKTGSICIDRDEVMDGESGEDEIVIVYAGWRVYGKMWMRLNSMNDHQSQ